MAPLTKPRHGTLSMRHPKSEAKAEVCHRSAELATKTPKPPPAAADEGYWLGCFFGDDFGHSAMIPENPAFSSWDVAGGRRGFDASPSAVGWKADHGVSKPGTGAAMRQ